MNIQWLTKWWRQRRQERYGHHVAITRLTHQVDQLAGQFRSHALATDTRLSVYDVLIPKVLADLNANLRALSGAQTELASSQTRIADLLEGKIGKLPPVKLAPLGAVPIPEHAEEVA